MDTSLLVDKSFRLRERGGEATATIQDMSLTMDDMGPEIGVVSKWNIQGIFEPEGYLWSATVDLYGAEIHDGRIVNSILFADGFAICLDEPRSS